MTTHQPVITTFAAPNGASFTGIFYSITRYFELRLQRARLCNDLEVLRAMDFHMLNDIGLKGFNRLSPAEQERMLLEMIKHAP